jgi:hypothetical protein
MSVPAENRLPPPAPQREDGRLVALLHPESMAAEQYRVLLARLDRMKAARPMRVVAVTSCARGEGRSMTAANLALTAAREGREVALVECDLRRPSLAALFDLERRAGGEGRLEEAEPGGVLIDLQRGELALHPDHLGGEALGADQHHLVQADGAEPPRHGHRARHPDQLARHALPSPSFTW